MGHAHYRMWNTVHVLRLMDRTPLGQKVSSFHMYVVGHSFSVHCTFSVLVHQLAQEEKDSGHAKYSTCT